MADFTSMSVTFDNRHGGTYIGNCSVSYLVPGSTQPLVQRVMVSGGQQATVDCIPVTASNMEIEVDFVAGSDDTKIAVADPAASWPNGKCVVDLRGVWPGQPSATLRTGS